MALLMSLTPGPLGSDCAWVTKGAALAIRPLLLRSDDRICGLLRILVIALRALTLLEFVARRQLAHQPTPLQGLYAGNPKRATQ